MKTFALYGAVVDTDEERTTIEDCTPGQFRAFTKNLEPNEELQISINSPGGSVYGGIAIANMIRQLSANGHKTTAFVEGLAASIASVIMCACDKVVLSESSLIMIHNCWSIVQGDANTLRKEADSMDVMNDAIISFYRSKFDLTPETLKSLMDQETWFSGKEAEAFKFNCEVIADEAGYKIAAKLKDIDLSKFKHLPKALKEIIMEKEAELKQANDEVKNEDAEASSAGVVEEKAEETKVEEPVVEEPKEEEVKEDVVVEETVPKAEVDKRVSGMQSAMAKQMDAMKKDYEAKIEDFKVQMKAKDEELAKVKAEAISLTEKLEKSTKELSDMTSAFEEKKNALDALNASVNTPNQIDHKPWAKLHGDELLKWCRENSARN